MALVLLSLSACSFVDIREQDQLRYQGLPVNTAAWNSIVPGHTDEQWVLRYLGQPAEIRSGEAGDRIFVYPLTAVRARETSVFLFYNKRATESSAIEKQLVMQKGKVSKVLTLSPEPAQPVTATTAAGAAAVTSTPGTGSAVGSAPGTASTAVDPTSSPTPASSTPASPAPASVPPQAANSLGSDPYLHNGADPFEHPWPLNTEL